MDLFSSKLLNILLLSASTASFDNKFQNFPTCWGKKYFLPVLNQPYTVSWSVLILSQRHQLSNSCLLNLQEIHDFVNPNHICPQAFFSTLEIPSFLKVLPLKGSISLAIFVALLSNVFNYNAPFLS